MVARRTFGEAVVAVAAVGKDRMASDDDQVGRGMVCEQGGGKEERENGGDTHVGVLADGLRRAGRQGVRRKRVATAQAELCVRVART